MGSGWVTPAAPSQAEGAGWRLGKWQYRHIFGTHTLPTALGMHLSCKRCARLCCQHNPSSRVLGPGGSSLLQIPSNNGSMSSVCLFGFSPISLNSPGFLPALCSPRASSGSRLTAERTVCVCFWAARLVSGGRTDPGFAPALCCCACPQQLGWVNLPRRPAGILLLGY